MVDAIEAVISTRPCFPRHHLPGRFRFAIEYTDNATDLRYVSNDEGHHVHDENSEWSKVIPARLDRSPSAIWHCLRRAGLVGRSSESSANWRVVLGHGGGLSLRMFRHHVDRQQRLCVSRFGCEPTR
jgi:hypothetical protein